VQMVRWLRGPPSVRPRHAGEPAPEKRKVWVIARQHPGETMTEFFAEVRARAAAPRPRWVTGLGTLLPAALRPPPAYAAACRQAAAGPPGSAALAA